MAGPSRRCSGLQHLARAAILAALVGLTAGGSHAQQIVTRYDHSQQDALPSSTSNHAGSMAAVLPTAVPATPDVTPAPGAVAKGPYYVDFRARTAETYGHAFVWFGNTSDKEVDVAGLAPAGDTLPYVLGHLIFVPATTGATYGDLDDQYLTASYRVYLNEADAKKVFAYIKHLQQSSPLWNAATANCTFFIGLIASYMGLKTPFHLLKPEEYVNELREMNKGRKTISLNPIEARRLTP